MTWKIKYNPALKNYRMFIYIVFMLFLLTLIMLSAISILTAICDRPETIKKSRWKELYQSTAQVSQVTRISQGRESAGSAAEIRFTE